MFKTIEILIIYVFFDSSNNSKKQIIIIFIKRFQNEINLSLFLYSGIIKFTKLKKFHHAKINYSILICPNYVSIIRSIKFLSLL